MDDKRLQRILQGPKQILFENGMPVLYDGKPVTGWLFLENGRWQFIPDMGLLNG